MRVEHLKIQARMSKEEYDANKFLVDTLLHRNIPVQDGDELKVDYSLHCFYCEQVEKSLRAFIALRESGITLDITVEEMNYGRSLIADILVHMDTLIKGQ